MCHSALSIPVAKTSRRPSSFTCALKRRLIPSFVGLPREFQVLQVPLGATCQMCHSALSALVAKTSNRPSSFSTTVGLLSSCKLGGCPKEDQVSQVPPVEVCQICHRSLEASTPTVQTKASRRPSSFFPTEGFAEILPGDPNEVQLIIPITFLFLKNA